MVIADALKKMGSNSPPFQPFVNRDVDFYEQKQMNWNSVCIKKDALFYQFKSHKGSSSVIRLLPDACLNVLFECDKDNPKALFSGTFLEPSELQLKPDTTYFGFKPFSNLGVKCPKIHTNELVEKNVDFSYAFPEAENLVQEMVMADEFDERIKLFVKFAKDNLIDHTYSPTFVDYFTVMLCAINGNVIFNNIEQITGYTERYCREKFKDIHGVSPKQYSSIIRFQNVMKMLVSHEYKGQSSLAYDNGYFDQAHLIRDFKKFASVSPERFRRQFNNDCTVSAVKKIC